MRLAGDEVYLMNVINPLHPAATRGSIRVRHTRVSDFARIIEFAGAIYPHEKPWRTHELQSQLDHFARGQLVAADPETDLAVGMATSLIVAWDDYGMDHTWEEITGDGSLRTHDPHGSTLYGADVMVDPEWQGRGVGKALYDARFQLCRDLNLRRIRAMSRIRGLHKHPDLTPDAYVERVVAGEIGDPTLTFQIRQGFEVLDVVPGYLNKDPESLGNAAVIEWMNPDYQPVV